MLLLHCCPGAPAQPHAAAGPPSPQVFRSHVPLGAPPSQPSPLHQFDPLQPNRAAHLPQHSRALAAVVRSIVWPPRLISLFNFLGCCF